MSGEKTITRLEPQRMSIPDRYVIQMKNLIQAEEDRAIFELINSLLTEKEMIEIRKSKVINAILELKPEE